ncbi:hypothetical protein ES705_22734 [subsurface metagenome]
MQKRAKTIKRKKTTDYNCQCPNCGSPAVKAGKEIVCEICDAIFVIRRTGGCHVRRMGVLKKLEDRVSELESEKEQSDKKNDGWFW